MACSCFIPCLDYLLPHEPNNQPLCWPQADTVPLSRPRSSKCQVIWKEKSGSDVSAKKPVQTYLHEVSQLRWYYEDIRGDWKLGVGIEILIVYGHVLVGRVEWVVAAEMKETLVAVNAGTRGGPTPSLHTAHVYGLACSPSLCQDMLEDSAESV